MEAFSLQKVAKMLEQVVVSLQKVSWVWQMKQNFTAQFIQLLKCWFCNVQSGIALEKNWALPIDQCRLQMLQFSVHLIDLLSVLLRCNGITEIQKAVENQSDSRLSVTMTFFWCKFDYGSALEVLLGSTTELVVTSCHIKSTFCCMS